MNLWIDEYAHLDSPLHRWNPRGKLLGLFALIFAFSLVSDVRFLPVMFGNQPEGLSNFEVGNTWFVAFGAQVYTEPLFGKHRSKH